MKKLFTFLTLLTCCIATGCNKSSGGSSGGSTDDGDDVSTFNEFDLDYEDMALEYGEFEINGPYEIIPDEDNTYVINVTDDKETYYISGYLEGRIVIMNQNQLSSYKGVKLVFSNCCIVSDYYPPVDYTLTNKNVEIVISGMTYLVNTSTENYDGCAINSENNVEIHGDGSLYVYTAHGHCIRADGDVRIYENVAIYLSSGHDGIHCHNFYSSSESGVVYDNGLYVENAISQCIETSKKDGTGAAYLEYGYFYFCYAESALKVDSLLKIGAVSVYFDNIESDLIVKASSGPLTIEVDPEAEVYLDYVLYPLQSTVIK